VTPPSTCHRLGLLGVVPIGMPVDDRFRPAGVQIATPATVTQRMTVVVLVLAAACEGLAAAIWWNRVNVTRELLAANLRARRSADLGRLDELVPTAVWFMALPAALFLSVLFGPALLAAALSRM
jgi:hypothetical protein